MVPAGLASRRAGGPRTGGRSRSIQPWRTGNPERHRAPGIRRARPAPRYLEDSEAGAGGPRSAGEALMSTAVQPMPSPFSPTASQIAVAYSVCRSITRSAAKNFYYAFLVLPAAKRQALCAVYAFMRRCDDIADDESLSQYDRRQKLTAWLDAFHRAQSGHPSDEPV